METNSFHELMVKPAELAVRTIPAVKSCGITMAIERWAAADACCLDARSLDTNPNPGPRRAMPVPHRAAQTPTRGPVPLQAHGSIEERST